MNDFFGVPMTGIMVVLLAILAVAFSAIGWVLLRNRVMFQIGIRNIPRRRAQTVLIIIGLMLSTLIISAAFSIGDTVAYSITNQAYDRLHSIDETVQAQTGDSSDPLFSVSSLISPLPIPEGQADQFVDAFLEVPGVDGAVSLIRAPVPVINERAGQTEPLVLLLGADPARMEGFPDIESLSGQALRLDDLGPDQVYVNESAAEELDIVTGDKITVFVAGHAHVLEVRDIVRDRVLTGAAIGETKGMVLPLERAQQVLGRPDEVDLIAVSNDGGVRGGVDGSGAVTKALNASLFGTNWKASETKRDFVDSAAEYSSFFVTFFVLLGMFSISAGLLLIFLIFVMLAAERKMEMGMVRAVGTKRNHLIQIFMSEGMVYNVGAAAVGCALGVAVSLVMVGVMAALFSAFDVSIVFHVTARSLVVAYSLGVVLTFLTVTFSSWRISNLNIVSAIRDVSDTVSKRAGRWSAALGAVGALLGALLLALGLDLNQGFPFMAGVSLFGVGVVLMARFLGVPSRPLFSSVGLFLLVFWLLGAGNRLPWLKDMEGGIEMFFLSGIAMVTCGTFVLVYNADLMLHAMERAGGGFSRLIPSIRTAVAYPLSNKFRTGMTVAMISLVMFALVMMSTMNENFDRVFLSEDSLGGYDVQVVENPSNPIGDLKAELAGRGEDAGGIAAVDRIRVANRSVAQVRNAGERGRAEDFDGYTILSPSDGFVVNTTLKFQGRATGMGSDREVWERLRDDPGAAVIDAFAIPSGGFGPGMGFSLEGIEATDKTFEPVTIEVRDAATGATREVQIIGVIGTEGSLLFSGVYLSPATFDAIFERPEATVHYVRLDDGADAGDAAKRIERTLLSQGAQADSLRKIIKDNQELSRGFLYLVQGFMGLGLLVGIAAVGVIAFRTVVERRQQIGMLRAIGFTRGAVALSFVMESSFVTLLGVLSGITLALLLASQLVQTDQFVSGGVRDFYIPWRQIAAMGGFAFAASLVMTLIPSRQASSIPIAQALRYE